MITIKIMSTVNLHCTMCSGLHCSKHVTFSLNQVTVQNTCIVTGFCDIVVQSWWYSGLRMAASSRVLQRRRLYHHT
uniref:Uncharacterized protein n=1 Tax=Anguilla anguilla TaxID=7936 RepID=A0A0E9XB87_ANGAN